jgi:hypothetical protein
MSSQPQSLLQTVIGFDVSSNNVISMLFFPCDSQVLFTQIGTYFESICLVAIERDRPYDFGLYFISTTHIHWTRVQADEASRQSDSVL